MSCVAGRGLKPRMSSADPRRIIVALTPRRLSDMATLDALAWLALQARRLGLELSVEQAPRALAELIALAGIADALGVQTQRHAEEREEPLRGEEEGELGDGAA
jgi:hypothetical protein